VWISLINKYSFLPFYFRNNADINNVQRSNYREENPNGIYQMS